MLKEELDQFAIALKKVEFKPVTIIFSSTILFTISWYYSNPKFLKEIISFDKSVDLIYEDLAAFSYWFISDIFLFLIIPLIIIKFLFHEKIIEYGFVLGNKKLGFSVTIFSIFASIPIIYFTASSDHFLKYSPLMQSATDNLSVFLVYEILFILFIYAWEFIFRGFMLFGLEKKFGLYAIFIQMIPFVILHNGKPFIETFASIFGALFLGYLALRTRSIFYGFLIHAIILVALDVLSLM